MICQYCIKIYRIYDATWLIFETRFHKVSPVLRFYTVAILYFSVKYLPIIDTSGVANNKVRQFFSDPLQPPHYTNGSKWLSFAIWTAHYHPLCVSRLSFNPLTCSRCPGMIYRCSARAKRVGWFVCFKRFYFHCSGSVWRFVRNSWSCAIRTLCPI